MINLILSHWVTNLLVVWLIVIVAANLWLKLSRRRTLNAARGRRDWTPRQQPLEEVGHSETVAHQVVGRAS
jgi:hypothetical protein